MMCTSVRMLVSIYLEAMRLAGRSAKYRLEEHLDQVAESVEVVVPEGLAHQVELAEKEATEAWAARRKSFEKLRSDTK